MNNDPMIINKMAMFFSYSPTLKHEKGPIEYDPSFPFNGERGVFHPGLFVYIIFFIFFSSLFSNLFALQEEPSLEEALAVRRIAEFWEEEEFFIAEKEIEKFLITYPESENKPFLYAILGDLLLKEKEYAKALELYEQSKTFDSNRLFCLLSLGKLDQLIEECRLALQERADMKDETRPFLALALAEKCKTLKENLEEATPLALEAISLFEELLGTSYRQDLALSYAHVCKVAKEFEKGANLYLELAEKNVDLREEFLFQAALFQAEFEPDKAIETLNEIAKKGGHRSRESAYNSLVLKFEKNQFQEITEKRDAFLSQVPDSEIGKAHLFLGRAFLAQQQPEKALEELDASLKKGAPVEEILPWILEAGYLAKNRDSIESVLSQLSKEDPLKARAKLLQIQLDKESGNYTEALERLFACLPEAIHSPYKQEILALEIELYFLTKQWALCEEKAIFFLTTEPKPELAKLAFKYQALSLLEQTGQEKPEKLFQLKELLATLFKTDDFFTSEEQNSWRLIFAKALYELGEYVQAEEEISLMAKTADTELLLALCAKDGHQDLSLFCLHAEEALKQPISPTLLTKEALHISLFNSYLEQGMEKEAAEHLYAAFDLGASIQKENALWLANRLFPDDRATSVLEALCSLGDEEEPLANLAESYLKKGDATKALKVLDRIEKLYASNPEMPWTKQTKTLLLAGEAWAKIGANEKALFFFDAVLAKSHNLQNFEAASAALQKAELQKEALIKEGALQDSPFWVDLAAAWKNLKAQKYLPNEPIHLEAALNYIDLQVERKIPLTKQLSLLEKTKAELLSEDDLLSRDYHQARCLLPEKDKLFRSYIQLLDAQILLTQGELAEGDAQKELKAKGKQLLLQILSESKEPRLIKRAKTKT